MSTSSPSPVSELLPPEVTLPGLTTPFLTSSLHHLKASASNATSAFNSSGLFRNMPRWFGPLTERWAWLQSSGSVIADATGERMTGIETAVQESMAAHAALASAAAASPVAETAAADTFRHAFAFHHVRNFGGIFTYMTSKWALACFTLAIVLNRTKIYTSGRRHLNLTFALRFTLRIAPILMFLAHTQSLLQAIRCQTSPNYSALKYGNASKHFDLDFASDGGLLYHFSSTLLFWQDDLESCRAVEMIRTYPYSGFRGSLSQLWPLFKTLCMGQFVETLSCAVQGRPIMTETGMSVFEHSLAFAEAEAMLSTHLGLSIFGFPKAPVNKALSDPQDSSNTISWLTKNVLFEKLNTPPEVLLMGFISCLNNLSSHVLALFDLQNRFRLLNTSIWGLCFLASFVWAFLGFEQSKDAGGMTLRFPTVCIVGFIPHLLVLLGIIGCAFIYLIALSLAVLSPPVGLPRPRSWRERLEVAHDNLQANVHLSTIRVGMHEDFYTALLKVGFTTLTVASEAVFLNEGKRIGVHRWTWLEEERLKEIQETKEFARERLEDKASTIVAGGVAMTENRASNESVRWRSGYARERTSKSLKPVPGTSTRAEGDGVGALQRSGRYMGAWELLSGIFWLTTGWMALIGLKLLRRLGLKQLPTWSKAEKSKTGEKRNGDASLQNQGSEQRPLDFWMLSDSGVLTLPPSDDVDVEAETKKRIKMNADGWGTQEERSLDSSLYNWWAHGGWWGDRDDSGDFIDPDLNDDDLTSEISLTESHADDDAWAGSDNDHADGRTTPTQRDPYPQAASDTRESTPSFPDHTLDPAHLAILLNPQTNEHRREAHMLAHHLSSDRIVTRSQYRRSQGHDRSHLLTSNPLNHPRGLRFSNPNGPLTREEEAVVLEHLLLAKRSSSSTSSTHFNGDNAGASWRTGGEGLGSSGPQCVVCQSAPRTVLAWPCRCLSLCEECRVSLAMNNFGTCVCCRQEVVGFSRLFVP
ncbi:MAG: hypothetical protein LQ344_000715 [Seirophora lacunosa]|nr:MAG: hypothetical protein LQ344_000715 [Seirophora lacunosa]